MSCTNCLNTKINPCVNEIYINLPLTANTPYIVTVTDHFGNEYQAEVETNADGAFYLYMDNTYPYTESEFPEGLFSNPITFVITTIGGDPVELESGSVTYDCFTTNPTSNKGENTIEPDGYPVVVEGECCFEITGTPYYLAMFNAAGDNIEDSPIFASILGPNTNYLEIQNPSGTGKIYFDAHNDDDQSSISLVEVSGSIGIKADTGLYGTGIGLELIDSASSNQLNIYIDSATGIPQLNLFDVVNDVHAVIKNDNGLQFVITDDKTITFSQETQDGSVYFAFGIDSARASVVSSLNYVEITADSAHSIIEMYNDSDDSSIIMRVEGDDTATTLTMKQAATEIFKASSSGISTDGSTNTWQLSGVSAGVPTVDTKIRVSINGVDYDIAAEAV